MAIPLGSLSGTEVLRRGSINAQSSTETTFKFDGTNPSVGQAGNVVPALHIITIMSIIVCEQGNANETFRLYIVDNSVDYVVLQSQALQAKKTYVWNDKFSLIGGNSLRISVHGGGNVDVWYSYIDQSWV